MPRLVVLLVAFLSAAFCVWLGAALPERVASHFGASGEANGYMPRSSFVALMLLTAVGLPIFIWQVQDWAAQAGKTNIPQAKRWFAPERRSQTIQALRWRSAVFCVLLSAFLCFVHWQVTRANASMTPTMDSGSFMLGLGVFLALVLGWLGELRYRFGRAA